MYNVHARPIFHGCAITQRKYVFFCACHNIITTPYKRVHLSACNANGLLLHYARLVWRSFVHSVSFLLISVFVISVKRSDHTFDRVSDPEANLLVIVQWISVFFEHWNQNRKLYKNSRKHVHASKT